MLENQSVQIVTIKNLIPLWKKDEPANSIELVQFEELGFEVVSQKDLYKIGDKAVFINPDYCLSDIPLFDSFLRPNGDPSKCKLGKNNRIRAIKFNFHRGDGIQVFSQGVLLPFKEVDDYATEHLKHNSYLLEPTLAEILGITKYEAQEESSGHVNGGSSAAFPKGMYVTDEVNIEKLWSHVSYPLQCTMTEKEDGSSITIYFNNNDQGIASRKLKKPLWLEKTIYAKTFTFRQKVLKFFGFKVTPSKEQVYVKNDSDFVTYGESYYHALLDHGDQLNPNGLALRGELRGRGLTGSGNKNNPAKDLDPDVVFYGADDYSTGVTERLPNETFYYIINALNEACQKDSDYEDSDYEDVVFKTTKIAFQGVVNSKEEIQQIARDYFANHKVEGLVIREDKVTGFSAKIMNPEYDAKK